MISICVCALGGISVCFLFEFPLVLYSAPAPSVLPRQHFLAKNFFPIFLVIMLDERAPK